MQNWPLPLSQLILPMSSAPARQTRAAVNAATVALLATKNYAANALKTAPQDAASVQNVKSQTTTLLKPAKAKRSPGLAAHPGKNRNRVPKVPNRQTLGHPPQNARRPQSQKADAHALVSATELQQHYTLTTQMTATLVNQPHHLTSGDLLQPQIPMIPKRTKPATLSASRILIQNLNLTVMGKTILNPQTNLN